MLHDKFIDTKFCPTISNIFCENSLLFKKMFSCVMMDLCEIHDMIDEIYNDSNDSDDSDDMEQTLFQYMQIYVLLFNFISGVFDCCVHNIELTKIIFSPEIITTFATSINITVGMMFNKSFPQQCIIEILASLMTIFIIAIKNNKDEFVKNIVNNSKFNIEYYEGNCFFKSKAIDIVDTLKELSDKNKLLVDEIDEIDIPMEFLDQITMGVIDDPCMLPDMQELFFNKSTIIKQLLIKEQNPYTRKHLDMDMFIKFNETNEIKNKCCVFMEEFSKWKKNKLAHEK